MTPMTRSRTNKSSDSANELIATIYT
ncbi:hypothetical protein L3V77_22705 [Vibrio sp. DW001]|nr:hypothetical protein [Vibrio sp. DW001]WED29936.1 hypothetical protein L3V77_22705 [Vibrio sp. DW001]